METPKQIRTTSSLSVDIGTFTKSHLVIYEINYINNYQQLHLRAVAKNNSRTVVTAKRSIDFSKILLLNL